MSYTKLITLKVRRDAAEEAYEDEMDTNREQRADESEVDYTKQNRLQEKFDKLVSQVCDMEKQVMERMRSLPPPEFASVVPTEGLYIYTALTAKGRELTVVTCCGGEVGYRIALHKADTVCRRDSLSLAISLDFNCRTDA